MAEVLLKWQADLRAGREVRAVYDGSQVFVLEERGDELLIQYPSGFKARVARDAVSFPGKSGKPAKGGGLI